MTSNKIVIKHKIYLNILNNMNTFCIFNQYYKILKTNQTFDTKIYLLSNV